MTDPTSTSQSPLLKTTLAIVAAYESGNIDAIMAFRSPKCTNHIFPTSLARPVFDNAAYRAVFEGVYKRIENFRLRISDVVEDERRRKVVLFADSVADTERGVGTYSQEYVIRFEFDEEGLLVKMVEWVDSVRAREQERAVYGEGGENNE